MNKTIIFLNHIIHLDEKIDSGNGNPKETKDENPNPEGSSTGKFFVNAWESSPRWWPEIFLISCVIGVLIDPLFLYIPVINENNKCLRRDDKMEIIALVLRSITDFAYVMHIMVRLQSATKIAKALSTSILMGLPWSYLLLDILAILPIPQVVVLVFFSKMAGSKSLTSRKYLNILLLAQYVPRILRIYVSAKELARDYNSVTRFVWVRGVFNLCLYIIAGHESNSVFGALWYFYSIFWETACWHHACKSVEGCNSDNSFDCHSKFTTQTKNVTYFNEICPVNPPNEKVYDFGIFAKAMESGILETTNFPRKFFKCFWWGLRNLSSFGSNLETSGEIWENIFAVIVSILGLVLFLYLIGNLQTYLQFITTKSEETRQKIRAKDPEIRSYLSNHNLSKDKERFIIKHLRRTITDGKEPDVENLLSLLEENEDHEQSTSEVSKENKDLERQKSEVNDKQRNQETFAEWVTKIVDAEKSKKNMSRSAELWISENQIPYDLKKNIMPYLRLRLEEGNKEVDVVNILHVLPSSLRTSIKKHLCSDILIKVPMIKTGYEIICKYLKSVIYSENTYIIRKGEPLDMMLFITQGIVWSFNKTSTERLQKGDYFGDEVLEWELENSKSCFTCFPISTKNVKAHTKVEAFALKAANLEQLFNLLVTRLQRRYRIHRTNKKKKKITRASDIYT
ncbi:hypothetical protein UlMin_045850 [Ulmus minor]